MTSKSSHLPTSAPPTSIGFNGAGHRVNWLGLWTIYVKEVRRFINVYMQTMLAPAVTTLLFLLIFEFSQNWNDIKIHGVKYTDFLVPGLIMMSMTQNAFANTSSSITISKVQGNIVDILMPPLSALELTVGYTLAGVTRGLIVGIIVGFSMACFVPIRIIDPLSIVFFALSGSSIMALFGILSGIWSEKFDHLAAVTNFIVIPATFLSGTFYSINRLPYPWNTLAKANPFFHMVDGFRAGFIGISDASLITSAISLSVTNLLLAFLTWSLLKYGYRLKA